MAQIVGRMDPLTIEVFWSRLISVVNEQAAALVRTSFSPPVAEAGDLSACVFDARGYLLAQAVTGTPGHINSMANCIREFLRVFPPETIRPGDVWITNDPWKTSGHLLDLTIVTPVFYQGNLVAFFGNICHVADIGGHVFSADARELYEEGLFIPIARLFKEGQPNEELFDIIQNNVRAPREVTSEIYSMSAANEVGAARLIEFLDEQKLASIEPLADEIIARSDQAMRQAIGQVPDGSYENAAMTDGYDAPIRLQVRVDVKGDAVHVDFAGTSPESPRGINVVLNYTHAYATFARQAPVAARHILGHFLPALIIGALAEVVPERIMAEGSANLWNTQFHGFHAD